MVETVKFRGKAQVVGIDGVGFRMELVSEDNSIPWSGDDVGQSFDVTIKRVAPEPEPEPAAPPSWDEAPEWVRGRGQNLNGAWYWYRYLPEYGLDGWQAVGHHALIRRDRPDNPNWRNTLQQRPKPEPLCPVCGKPASEHRDGLWCCGHCGGEATYYEAHPYGLYIRCTGCKIRTPAALSLEHIRPIWNRRA